jgi:hypothetical protein
MNRQAGVFTSISISARIGTKADRPIRTQAIRRGKPGSEARETEDVTPHRPGSKGARYCSKWRFANARPEPDFK